MDGFPRFLEFKKHIRLPVTVIRPCRCSTIPCSLQPVMPWVDAERDLKLSKALLTRRFPLERIKDSPPLQPKCLGRVTLLPGTELTPVSFKTRKHFPRSIHILACFQPSFPCRKNCFLCQFLFSWYKLCLRYTAGNFNENPSIPALANILWARASEH